VAQIRLIDKTGSISIPGKLVKYSDDSHTGFIYASENDPAIIGKVASRTIPNFATLITLTGSVVDLVLNSLIASSAEIDSITSDLIVSLLARFGSSPDYTEFESDGTMKMNGDATVWEDLNFDPTTSGGPAATIPDYVTINNVVHREFTSANNQLCGDGEEIPHKYKLSSTIYPHIHVFLKNGESAGTTGAAFTFYWELRQTTGTTSGSVVLTATSASLAGNPHKVDVFDVTGFAGAAELGAQLTVKIARTAGNAGDVIVTTYGVHYEIDPIGSRQLSSK